MNANLFVNVTLDIITSIFRIVDPVNPLPRLEQATTRRQEQIVELYAMLKNRMNIGCTMRDSEINIGCVSIGCDRKERDISGVEKATRQGVVFLVTLAQLWNLFYFQVHLTLHTAKTLKGTSSLFLSVLFYSAPCLQF